ncbi:flavin reductase family protein [Streptomyces sp. H10-C2]|uniref:flavin reductase family protein n=1 Tax=unclassified Streptomyces TaxID=2593676 RepID=UPI0024BB5750|nr:MULTISPECIES: flavin reductase family protein [unclassified Streptomyces]MDJ0346782.1 flavin reductase family protein [Streptomyces sp. PH10-H1]MDJ0374092.1 flavin reductase family protein [Streptomyces sp. H10-C2]
MVDMDRFTDLLDYPMYVVTTAADGERSGCLVGFASQCSLDPPRFVVWLSKANHTYPVAERATFLAVHLLGSDQKDIAGLFGGETGDQVDKFSQVRWSPGRDGIPILMDVAAWFLGRIGQRADWGDHVGFLLSPVDSDAMSLPRGSPLRLSDVLDVDPGHPA